MSAESSQQVEREIAAVKGILSKRKYINWKIARLSIHDIRPERLDQDGPFEYLVEWVDGK